MTHVFKVMVTVATVGGIGVFVFPGGGDGTTASSEPLPREEYRSPGPLRSEWRERSARLTALRVDLDVVGLHTHANWAFFRLPFDTTASERVRNVLFIPSATIDPDVAAIRFGGACAPYKRYGPITTWAGYTAGAVGPTLPFSVHPSAPTNDPTIYGLNVPSRVANYVACGWEKSAALRDPASWQLTVTWEER